MQLLEPQWREQLASAGIGDFDAVWKLPIKLVDDPNRGRGGWSEVGYYPLPVPVEDVTAVYVKRQEDFSSFYWKKPVKGQPTFQREYQTLLWCLERELPVVRPVAFDVREQDGHTRAILITQALDDYISLDNMQYINALGLRYRRKIIRHVACVVRKLHAAGLQHGCLYPKHIFVRPTEQNNEAIDVQLIDFEKAGPLSFWNKGVYRDLDSLNRRAYDYTLRDRLVFLSEYCEGDRQRMRMMMDRISSRA